MVEPDQHSLKDSWSDIRIKRLSKEKTRKTNRSARGGSVLEYQVYLELSGIPTQAWKDIFERKWKILSSPKLWQEASIDKGFLVMHCHLKEIAVHLPVLKEAVLATNVTYKGYAQEPETELELDEIS